MAPKDLGIVILAAGKGTRLKSSLAKVLHRAGGRALVEQVLRACAPLGAKKTVVVVGHQAEQVMAVVEPTGAKTVLHRHGVPLFAYILEGEITVDYGDRGKRTYRAGDAPMEAMDVPHFGADAGPQPVRILTVFIGAEGAPADVIPVKP